MKKLSKFCFDGYALKKVRIVKKLHQQDIANKASVSKQLISQIENNQTSITEITAKAIAEAVDCKVSYFYQDLDNYHTTQKHFRSQKSVTTRDREYTIFSSELKVEILQSYIKEITSHQICDKLQNIRNNFGLPNEHKLLNEQIAKIAMITRKIFADNDTKPIKNLIRLLESRGFLIHEFDNVPDKIDGFSVISNSKNSIPFILLNPNIKSNCRRRHTLAHELGHYILHKFDTGSDLSESQADCFAGHFLLPQEVFMELAKNCFDNKNNRIYWSNLLYIKENFGVSLSSLIYRASQSGIIPKTFYRNAYMIINKKGWRKIEPGDEEMEIEKPNILPKIIENFKKDDLQIFEKKFNFSLSLIKDVFNLDQPHEERVL